MARTEVPSPHGRLRRVISAYLRGGFTVADRTRVATPEDCHEADFALWAAYETGNWPTWDIRDCFKPFELPDPMPLQEPERSAEAIRRSLPELLKLDRYERRATSRRDRAVRELRNVVRKDSRQF